MARSMKHSKSLPQSVTIACFSWLIVLNRRRWQTICWRAPQVAQSTGFKSGLFGHMRGSNVTFSRRRHVSVFLAVCDGAPTGCSHQCKMPVLLLQDVTVTLDKCFLKKNFHFITIRKAHRSSHVQNGKIYFHQLRSVDIIYSSYYIHRPWLDEITFLSFYTCDERWALNVVIKRKFF